MKDKIDIYSDNIQYLLNNNLANAQILESVNFSNSVSPELRIYDNVARVFSSVLSPCASAIRSKLGDKIYLSFNSDKHALYEQNKAVINFITNACFSDQNKKEYKPLIGLISFFQYKNDIFFKNAIKKACKENTNVEIKKLQSTYSTLSKNYFPKNKSQGSNEKKLEFFLKNNAQSLTDFVDCYSQLISYNYSDRYIFEDLIRPLQDLHKVHQFFLNKNIKTEFINSDKGHAELNILFFIKDKKIEVDKNYIGVSKPCCFLCSETVMYNGFKVVASHNIYYEQNNILSYIKSESGFKPLIQKKFRDYLEEEIEKINKFLINKSELPLDYEQDFNISEDIVFLIKNNIILENVLQRIDLSFDLEVDRSIKISLVNKTLLELKEKIISFHTLKKMLTKKQTEWIEGKQITDALKDKLDEVTILSKYHENSIESLVEVDSLEAFEQILRNIKKDSNFIKGIMPLKVNGITKELNVLEQKTSHWVGIYIEYNSEKQEYVVKYVDPMGHPISIQVRESIEKNLIKELHLPQIIQPINGTVKQNIEEIINKTSMLLTRGIQYACYESGGLVFTEDSNINDCGAFVTRLLISLWNGKEEEIPQEYFNKIDSEELGQNLRKNLGFTQKVVEKLFQKDSIEQGLFPKTVENKEDKLKLTGEIDNFEKNKFEDLKDRDDL